jgi:hypothetical protein
MLKKSASFVLTSLRGSTYRSVRLASSLAAALLNGIFEHPADYSGTITLCIITAECRAKTEFSGKLLEEEDGGADFVGLAVLNEFDFTFIGEEEEAVFHRERLALLDELDEVALFGVGEFVSLAVVWTCHKRCSLFHYPVTTLFITLF